MSVRLRRRRSGPRLSTFAVLLLVVLLLAVPYSVAVFSPPSSPRSTLWWTAAWSSIPVTAFLLYIRRRLRDLGLTKKSPQQPEEGGSIVTFGTCPQISTNDDASGVTLARCLLVPSLVTDRIREVVTPLTRALEITSVHTVTPLNDDGFYYPVLYQRKGILVDALEVSVGDSVAPMISQSASSTLLMSAFDLVAFEGQVRSRKYNAALRQRIFDLIAGPVSPSTSQDVEDLKKKIDAAVVSAAHVKLMHLLLSRLAYNYVHAVWIPEGGESVVVRERHRVIQSLHLDSLREVIKKRSLASSLEILRAIAGTTPASFRHPLSAAARCHSYHLELFGMPGTYLARQGVLGVDDNASVIPVQIQTAGENPHASYRRFRRRRGQRYLHLYIRGGTDRLIDDHLRVSAGFFERPPGSTGAAAIASLASTVLIVAGGAVQSSRPDPNGDLLAVLLAFPFVAGSIMGLSLGSGPLGGVMLARVGGYITAGLSTAAAVSALGYHKFDGISGTSLFGSSGGWVGLVAFSTATTLVLLGAWALRSIMYAMFLRRPDQLRSPDNGNFIDFDDQPSYNSI